MLCPPNLEIFACMARDGEAFHNTVHDTKTKAARRGSTETSREMEKRKRKQRGERLTVGKDMRIRMKSYRELDVLLFARALSGEDPKLKRGLELLVFAALKDARDGAVQRQAMGLEVLHRKVECLPTWSALKVRGNAMHARQGPHRLALGDGGALPNPNHDFVAVIYT